MKSYQYLVFIIALDINSAQSLLTFHSPGTKRLSLLQRQVGLSHLPPPQYDNHPTGRTDPASHKSLSTFEKAWTKYCMISYVAHMCVAIPLALLPIYIKSKLQLSPKTTIESEALQVGQACARTLLTLIPFMVRFEPLQTLQLPSAPRKSMLWIASRTVEALACLVLPSFCLRSYFQCYPKEI